MSEGDLVHQWKSTTTTQKSAQKWFPAEDESVKYWNKKTQRPTWSHRNMFLELQMSYTSAYEPKIHILQVLLIISIFTF